jgi:hypothetical protein
MTVMMLLYSDFEILSEQDILAPYWDGDATARVRASMWITNVETGSNQGPTWSGSPYIRL